MTSPSGLARPYRVAGLPRVAGAQELPRGTDRNALVFMFGSIIVQNNTSLDETSGAT